ncbi:ATPase [Spirochaetia bacterium]|nr:ATPase [Spirochaetia bacterium]
MPMLDIRREVQKRVADYCKPRKVALILGARRVGKTVLIGQILKDYPGKVLLLNGEDYDTHALLEQRSAANYRRLLDGVDLLALDEAQNIPDIGQKLKLMADEIPHIGIIASGSSSFDLLHKAGEPLVGRSARFHLSPFSQREIAQTESPLETRQNLEDRLVYGSYPEAVLLKGYAQKAEYLREIVNAYLLKDILAIDGIKNSGKMRDLLRLLSYQMGNEVSYDELGRQLGMSKNTVEKYLDLLAGVFVVYRLGSYARNLRKEIVKAGKWYFCDNGIRNAIIGNFKPLALRQDTGALWESYLINERMKNSENEGIGREYYFWRTYDHQEIDLIEAGENLRAFEFKWGAKQSGKARIPAAFAGAYPEAEFRVVDRENYGEFI